MQSSSSGHERPAEAEGIVSLHPQAWQPLRTYRACSSCPPGSPSIPCSAFGDAHVSSSRAWVPPSYSQESQLWEGVVRSREGEGRVSTAHPEPCYRNHRCRAEGRVEGSGWTPRTADRTPKNSLQLTSREDLALVEIEVHITSTGVRGVGTLGSSGP